MGDQVLVAPPGVTRPDQFVGNNTERMPTPPRQANSLIVGGPAYFTPEGYQAPYQPEQSFMPTNVAPDPIRDQFNRMYPTPPPPPPAPAPAPAPTPVYEPVVEPVAGPDPVTEPVVEPVVPPGAYPPYIPGVTPFPGIPGLGDLDFSGLPGMGDIDIDRIIQEYQDRQNAGEPEPFDSFLPEPVSTPEPEFVPPPPEPNGFFPGIDPRDFEDMSFEDMDFTNLGNMDFSNLPKYTPPPPVSMPPPYFEDFDFGNNWKPLRRHSK
jgi:hypothetical protein